LRACTDGTATPCSPNGQLNVRGFICNADRPQLVPVGDTGIELSARNLAPTPGAMQFSYEFAAGTGGSTPTPQRTATATGGVTTRPTIGAATRTPTPSRTATRQSTFTPSVTRTPKVVSLAFVRANSFDVSHEPTYVAVGDFNRDGRDDVAISSPESKEVNALLGNVDGSFTPGTVARFGTFPGFIVSGDLNGDPYVDLAVVDERAGGVFLIYGGPNGTFGTPTLKLVGRRPFGVAIANFDGETGNDLAVTDRDANRVLVLLNDGKPTPQFRNGGSAAVGSGPTDIVTGDFNGDGQPDLATLNNGGSAVKDVTLLVFNRVEGGLVVFTRIANLVVGDHPIDLSVAELNSDDRADLVMLNRPVNDGFGEVDYLLSQPAGIPTQGDPLVVHCPDRTVHCRARALAVGDFDNDNISDIAVTLNQTGQGLDSDVLIVLLGTGDGGFIPGPTLPAAGQPLAMGTGDFTGDGRVDIVVTSAQEDSVQVYVNVGNPN
jgi:FG-GAP-like repeat